MPDSAHLIPVRVNNGYFILRVDDTRKAELFPTYEKSKDHYKNMLTQINVNKQIQKLNEKANIKIGK